MDCPPTSAGGKILLKYLGVIKYGLEKQCKFKNEIFHDMLQCISH